MHCVHLENGIHKKILEGSYPTEKHFAVSYFTVNYAHWSGIILQGKWKLLYKTASDFSWREMIVERVIWHNLWNCSCTFKLYNLCHVIFLSLLHLIKGLECVYQENETKADLI